MTSPLKDRAERYFEEALGAIKVLHFDRAASLLVEAIKCNPEFSEAWVTRGNVLHACERHFDAILHYDRALNINEKMHDAWNNRGIAFADIGMWPSAEDSFRKSMALLNAVEPHIGLANMFCTLNRLEDAAREYRACVAIDPGFLDARFNLGVTLLGLGQWDEGFKEYEYRWQNTPYPPASYRNYPKWTGEGLSGKRILLYPEQGYGDEIMALRFAGAVRNLYDDCTVMVQARGPMLRLAEVALNRGECVAMSAEIAPEFAPHYSCPLLDVPMVLGLQAGQAPFLGQWKQYLQAPDRDMVGLWRRRLSNALPKGLNVGLCWSSGGHLNTAKAAQQSKSIPLPRLKGLALAGVNLISLQKDNRERIPDGFPIAHDWIDDCHDFADTAALVEALDLVISVDTSVAHLAGALGKPVWNFVRFSGYWPWLAPDRTPNPEHSIWYPSMTLLRQPSLGNWYQPIERAEQLLREELGKRAAA